MFALVVTLALASTNTADVLDPVSPATPVSGGECRPSTDLVVNGSRSQFDPLGRGVWLIDDENDEVLLLELVRDSTVAATTPRAMHRFSPGRWPEQLVVAPDGRVFVTSRESGQVFVIAPDFSTTRIALAPEPRSLALDVTHHRLYVGLVTSRELVALDSDSGAVLQRRVVDQPPDFLALSASGLLVASRRDDVLSVFGTALEPRGALVVEAPRLPVEVQSQGLGMFNLLGSIDPIGFSASRRVRGVAALTATATQVSVVVEEAAVSGSGFLGFGLIGTGRGRGSFAGSSGYGGGGGAPISHFLFAARAERDGVFIEKRAVLLRNSVVTELAVADGRTCVLSETIGPIQCFDEDLRTDLIQIYEARRTQLSAMVISEGQLVITTRAREVHFVDAVPEPQRGPAFALVTKTPRRVPNEWTSESVGQLPPSRLDEQLRRGRALFHSADLRISTGGGLACVSCHPDGREDGRVWTQANTLRQTPMLADRLVGTAPYNWLGTSGTLEANIHQTIVERLGGMGLSKQDTAALSRFLLEGLRPVTTRQTAAPALVARGAELFADEEVGCAQCHSAQRQFTDGKGHDVKFVSADEERDFVRATGSKRVPKKFDTPSLTHLKVTAPYLHNGQAQTLAMLLETNHDRMGATTQLSVDEREALVAYLESL